MTTQHLTSHTPAHPGHPSIGSSPSPPDQPTVIGHSNNASPPNNNAIFSAMANVSLNDNAEATNTRTMITLDPLFYPHIFDLILEHVDVEGFMALRPVCKDLQQRAEVALAHHITLVEGRSRRVMPGLPLAGCPRFPKTNFWRVALKKAVKIIDIPFHDPKRSLDLEYPQSLAKLPNVDIIRDFSGRFSADLPFPLPPTREWIAHLGGYRQDMQIAGEVMERVILVLPTLPGLNWQHRIPDRPLDTVVILQGPNWTSCDETASYQCGSNCTQSTRMFANALAFLVACRIAHFAFFYSNRATTVTLVDVDRFLAVATKQGDSELARAQFIDMVLAMGQLTKEIVTPHLIFMSRNEYRDLVGEERYQLQTVRPSYLPESSSGDEHM